MGVALVFAVFAAQKLVGPNWITLFDAIGRGLLLLVPQTARIGGVLVGSSMVGAMFIHLAVLDTGIGGAIVPGALLPLVIAAAWKGRGEIVEESGFSLH